MTTSSRLTVLLVVSAACSRGAVPPPLASPAPPTGKVDVARAVEPPVDPSARAAAAWQGRAKRAQAERAIALFESLAADGGDAARLTLLARAYCFLAGEHLAPDGDATAALAAYAQGMRAGEAALLASAPGLAAKVAQGEAVDELLPLIGGASADAAYWYLESVRGFTLAKGLTALVYYRQRIVRLAARLLELDGALFHAGPHRSLALFYAESPSAAGGDLGKARAEFERALALEPHYLAIKVAFAESYATRVHDRELVTRLLGEAVADATLLPEVEPEQAMARARAQKLLAHVDELF